MASKSFFLEHAFDLFSGCFIEIDERFSGVDGQSLLFCDELFYFGEGFGVFANHEADGLIGCLFDHFSVIGLKGNIG